MQGEIYALSAAVLWAFAAVLTKDSVDKANVLVVNLIRITFGSLFLFIFYIILNGFEFGISMRSFVLLSIGAFLAIIVGDLLYFKSMRYASLSRVLPVASAYPLFVFFFAFFLVGEDIRIKGIMGTIFIIAGITFLSRGKTKIEKNVPLGVFLSISAAMVWGLAISIMKLGLEGTDPFLGNVMRLPLLIPVLFILISYMYGTRSIFKQDRRVYINMGIAGVIALSIGATLFLASISMINAGRATALSSTTPLYTAILAWIFLKEKVTSKMAMGIIAIVAGIWIIVL